MKAEVAPAKVIQNDFVESFMGRQAAQLQPGQTALEIGMEEPA